jgi:hypothetical protein
MKEPSDPELLRLREVERQELLRFYRLSRLIPDADAVILQASRDLWQEAAAAVRAYKASHRA